MKYTVSALGIFASGIALFFIDMFFNLLRIILDFVTYILFLPIYIYLDFFGKRPHPSNLESEALKKINEGKDRRWLN